MVSVIQTWLSQHVSWGCSYLKVQMEEDFLYGCWLIPDCCLSKPVAPCHLRLSIGLLTTRNIAACLPQSRNSKRGREGKEVMSKMEVSLLVTNTGSGIPSLLPCYFCQKQDNTKSSPYPGRRGLHKGVNTRRWGLVRAILESACLPHFPKWNN